MLWPENVVNVDAPFEESDEFDELSELARQLGAPLIVGVVEGFRDRFYNYALVYDAEGEVVDRFDKVQRVPSVSTSRCATCWNRWPAGPLRDGTQWLVTSPRSSTRLSDDSAS